MSIDHQVLSEAETLIMEEFWNNGTMDTSMLQPLAATRGWKPTTLLTFLSRLVKKGMLSVEKQGKSNLYTPIYSQQQYKNEQAKTFLDEQYGGSATALIASMVNGKGLSKKDLNELRQWLDRQEDEDD